MTYCVGMCLRDGILLASDSRTNAGVDYVTSYSKMHLFNPAPDRLFVLLSAGNLATTQEVINRMHRDLDSGDGEHNLHTARYLFEAADYVARISREVQMQHNQALHEAGVSGEVTLIMGGQIQGQPHGMVLIYPQGNYIEASEKTPFLQIGETKYGKPVLDRLLRYDSSLQDAARLSLVSLSSTAKSNITVGPPFELALYRSNQFRIEKRCSFDYGAGYLEEIEKSWNSGLLQAFNNLPRFEWELQQELDPASSYLQQPLQASK